MLFIRNTMLWPLPRAPRWPFPLVWISIKPIQAWEADRPLYRLEISLVNPRFPSLTDSAKTSYPRVFNLQVTSGAKADCWKLQIDIKKLRIGTKRGRRFNKKSVNLKNRLTLFDSMIMEVIYPVFFRRRSSLQ